MCVSVETALLEDWPTEHAEDTESGKDGKEFSHESHEAHEGDAEVRATCFGDWPVLA
jgi:hypothetical protein